MRFERSEIERRFAKARAACATADVALLLADHGEFLAWLTGYTVSETRYRAAFLPLTGAPWFVLRDLDTAPCRAKSWVEQIVGFADAADPYAVIAETVRARGFAEARIGVDFQSYGFTAATHAALGQHLPKAQFVDMPAISDRLRAVKSSQEIASIAQAARIADATMQYLEHSIRPGMSPRTVAALAAPMFLENGADSGETGPIALGIGDQGFLHAALSATPLWLGDRLHVELTPKLANYSARLMRPIFIGEIPCAAHALAERLIAFQDEQISAMKPGAKACDVDAILRAQLIEAGLRSHYDNVTGYMLGLYARTPRASDFSHAFLPTSHWFLEEDMVFHMYVSAQGLGFSETVRVTENGGQRLTQTRRAILQSPTVSRFP